MGSQFKCHAQGLIFYYIIHPYGGWVMILSSYLKNQCKGHTNPMSIQYRGSPENGYTIAYTVPVNTCPERYIYI